jgi:hypothetical protein
VVLCAAEPASLPKLNRVGGQIWNFSGRIGGGMTPVSPHSSVFLLGKMGSMKMKTIIAVVALALPLLSSAALAQERTGDAALGALSGAVVLGPVGALAGAVVGYTAGPSIAHSWGLRHSSSRRQRQSAKQSHRRLTTTNDSRRAADAQTASPKATPAAAAAPSTMPPVQALD